MIDGSPTLLLLLRGKAFPKRRTRSEIIGNLGARAHRHTEVNRRLAIFTAIGPAP